MSKNSRGNRPYVRPVTRLEVNQSNVKLRWILVCVMFAIAIVAFAVGLFDALETEPGWQSINVGSDKPNCGSEFVLAYDFSASGGNATLLNKELSTKYSNWCEEAYAIFSPDVSMDGEGNVRAVNASVNREVTVHPALYDAFALLNEYENRCLFLAPVYVEYDRLFRSESDPEAADKDPAKNPEVRSDIDEMMAFIADESMISLELLGENRVLLHVAPEYLNYAQENDISEFIDFGWMTNAFAADYLAEQLSSGGYTDGYLASYDGFTRNLARNNQTFHLNLFDLRGKDVYMPAVMEYGGQTSLVSLRSYPMDDRDQLNRYVYEDGEIVNAMIDPADGISKRALNNLVSYSKDYGCAEILLNVIPGYVADTFHAETLNALAERNIFSVWFADGTLCHNDAQLKVEMLTDTTGNTYQKDLKK